MMGEKIKLLYVLVLFIMLSSCLGVGQKAMLKETLKPVSYEKAFDVALASAERMSEECKATNPFNFPVIVSTGTSKSRGVITLHYRFDPEAGSVCTKPPIDVSSFAKRTFVPHFACEFYMHIRLLKDEGGAPTVSIEVTQWKGVKKEAFDKEAERLMDVYRAYLHRGMKDL